jgi:hypothetical protein
VRSNSLCRSGPDQRWLPRSIRKLQLPSGERSPVGCESGLSGLVRLTKAGSGLKRYRAERRRRHEMEVATRRRVVDDHTLLLNLQGTWFRVEIAGNRGRERSDRSTIRCGPGSLHGFSSRRRRRPSSPSLRIQHALCALKASELQARAQGLRPEAVRHGRLPERRVHQARFLFEKRRISA